MNISRINKIRKLNSAPLQMSLFGMKKMVKRKILLMSKKETNLVLIGREKTEEIGP